MASCDGACDLVDFFADTPAAANPLPEVAEVVADFGTARQVFHIGAGTSAAPGFALGLHALHARARMPMPELVAPAVAHARDGVVATRFQAFVAHVVAPILTWSESARALFAPEGRLIEVGEERRNPELAEALSALAADPQALDDAMLADQQDGGHLRSRDFAGDPLVHRKPLTAAAGAFTVMLNPPPSIGGERVAAMLAGLEGRGPDALVAALEAGEAMDVRKPFAYRGTTHVSAVDADGNAVAATVSNGEGNGRVVPGCGFMLNNFLGETDLNPHGPSDWPTATRLSSMMCPTIAVANGDVLALGSGGSSRIRSGIFRALEARCVEGLSPREAVEAARLHLEDGRLDVECGDEAAVAAGRARGHDVRAWEGRSLYFGGVHLAERLSDGRFAGAGDPRREGCFLVA